LPTLKPSQISHVPPTSSVSTSSSTLDSGSTYASAKWFSKVSSAVAELDQVESVSCRRRRRRGSTSIQSFCLLNSRFSEAYLHCTWTCFYVRRPFSKRKCYGQYETLGDLHVASAIWSCPNNLNHGRKC
jgi:hypothetical protein